MYFDYILPLTTPLYPPRPSLPPLHSLLKDNSLSLPCVIHVLMGMGPTLEHGRHISDHILKGSWFSLPQKPSSANSFSVLGSPEPLPIPWWDGFVLCRSLCPTAAVCSWVEQPRYAQKTLVFSSPPWPLAPSIFLKLGGMCVWQYRYAMCDSELHWHLFFALWPVVNFWLATVPVQRKFFEDIWELHQSIGREIWIYRKL